MENNSLVSVIIPAYNHEKYVQETIKSLIAQTYQNIELIILDDGSTDSTWEKICEMKEECEKRFTCIDFSTKENEGTCTTLNKLIKKVNGEYFYIIASDDMAKPYAIELELQFLNKNPDYCLAVGNNEIIDNKGQVCYWDKDRNIVYNKNHAQYLTFADFLKDRRKDVDFNFDNFGSYKNLYRDNYIPNGYLIRKSTFNLIEPFTKEAPLEDWFLMLQLSKYGKFKYLDEVLFSYRWHDTNTIKNVDKMNIAYKNTKNYELKKLQNLDFSTVLPEVKEVAENGVCYEKVIIPFLYKKTYCLKYPNLNRKTKIFGITVSEKNKIAD